MTLEGFLHFYGNWRPSVGYPPRVEREGWRRGIQLVAICNLAARCHSILHNAPLSSRPTTSIVLQHVLHLLISTRERVMEWSIFGVVLLNLSSVIHSSSSATNRSELSGMLANGEYHTNVKIHHNSLVSGKQRVGLYDRGQNSCSLL